MSGFTDHFSAAGDVLAPQPWMQMREVQSASAESVAKSYDPSDGLAKNDLLQTITASWTNNSPITQVVYGLVTRVGAQVALQCKSRGYIETAHGVQVGPAAIEMVVVSKFGTGADVGQGGLLSFNTGFAVAEVRSNSSTVHLLPQTDAQWNVAPGQTINAKVEIRFKSEAWEANNIDGGDTGTESKVVSGDTLLQLMAIPAVVEPPAVQTPTLPGGAGNVRWDREIDLGLADTKVGVAKPTGLVIGDHLIAIVVNQLGLASAIQPVQSGWTLLHSRNDGGLLGGLGQTHIKIYLRRIVGGEPSVFEFTNGLLAEETGIIIPIRGAAPYEPGSGESWYVSSNLSTWRMFSEHSAPSIQRQGQLLLCVSFFSHGTLQSPINQTPPTGMTELVDLAGSGSTVSVAMLSDPPMPTLARKFTASKKPLFSQHAIAASILIPGA